MFMCIEHNFQYVNKNAQHRLLPVDSRSTQASTTNVDLKVEIDDGGWPGPHLDGKTKERHKQHHDPTLIEQGMVTSPSRRVNGPASGGGGGSMRERERRET